MPATGVTKADTFAWLNTNKRSLSADLDRPAVRARRSARLLANAPTCCLMRGIPPSSAHRRLSHENSAVEPGLAITAISWFGERGPYRDYARHQLGLPKPCRSGRTCRPDRRAAGPAARRPDRRSCGSHRVHPEPRGLYARDHQGARRFAVSALEAMLQISEFDTALALESGFTRPRHRYQPLRSRLSRRKFRNQRRLARRHRGHTGTVGRRSAT